LSARPRKHSLLRLGGFENAHDRREQNHNMARTVSDELRYADMEARRYVRSQWTEAEKLGYPKMTSFAKDIARGTVSLAPTPEDAVLEQVGRFLWTLSEIQRRVVFSHYGEKTPAKVKAHQLGMTTHRFAYLKTMALRQLAGYLLPR
jgi:hypothetical protein